MKNNLLRENVTFVPLPRGKRVLQKSLMYDVDQILYISRILPQMELLPIQ